MAKDLFSLTLMRKNPAAAAFLLEFNSRPAHIFLFALTLSSFLPLPVLGAPHPAISSIKIISENSELNSHLKQKLKSNLGEPLSETKLFFIKQKIAKYLLSNKYRNSHIKKPAIQKEDSGQAAISFEIGHPYAYEFIFQGNREVSSLDLNQALDFTGPFTRDNFLYDTVKKIKNKYKSLAYNNAEVDIQHIPSPKKYTNLIKLKITEGQRFIIKKISINEGFKEDKGFYKKIFYQLASLSIKKNLFVEEEFNETLQKTIVYLRQLGWYFSKIYYKNIRFQKNQVLIEILIDRGPPITIGSMRIEGGRVLSKKEIKKIIKLEPGAFLNILQLNERLGALMDAYKDKGFLKAKIKNPKNIIKINEEEKTAVVTIKIHEGEKSRLGKLKVKGNKKVKSSFILHASSLKEGELVDQEKLDKARGFIEDLGLFASVRVDPDQWIEVREQNFKYFQLRGGISTENNLSARASIEGNINRFLGDDGSKALFTAQGQSNSRLISYLQGLPSSSLDDYFERRLSGVYKKYYFMNTRWSWLASYSFSDTIFSFITNELQQQKYSTAGVEWEQSQKISFNLERKFDLQTTLNFKLFEIDLIESYRFSGGSAEKDPKGETINEIGVFFNIDKRDNFLFAKSGHQFEYSLNYSSPLIGSSPQIHYIRSTAKEKYYLPFFDKKLVFAQSLSSGFILNIDNKEIPSKHLFLLGGLQSLRGYDGRRSGDRVPSRHILPLTKATETFPYSSMYYLLKSEIRFPLFIKNIGMAFFYDIGGVHVTNVSSALDYKHSAGVSFHYISPLGPFVLTAAQKLNPSPAAPGEEEKSSTWYSFSMIAF